MESNLEATEDPGPVNLIGIDVSYNQFFVEVESEQGAFRESLTKCITETEKGRRKSGSRKSISPTNTSTKSLHLISEHIETLQKLKETYTKRFILDLRNDISAMWVKCCYGESQQSEFEAYTSETFTEEVLVQHEHALKHLKDYYTSHKDLYKLITKREKLWKEKVAFENPADGCSRFENRGGTLIKELKRIQIVEKQLPIAEKEIKLKIKSWEKENQTKFQMHDLPYVEYIESQKQEYKTNQEAKRAAKKAAKQEELLAETSSNTSQVLKKSSSSENMTVSKPVGKEGNQESLKELMRPTEASLLKSRNFSTPSARSRLSVNSASLKRSAPLSKPMKISSTVTAKVPKLDLSGGDKSPNKENFQPHLVKSKTPLTKENPVKVRPLLQSSAMKRKLQRRSLGLKKSADKS